MKVRPLTDMQIELVSNDAAKAVIEIDAGKALRSNARRAEHDVDLFLGGMLFASLVECPSQIADHEPNCPDFVSSLPDGFDETEIPCSSSR